MPLNNAGMTLLATTLQTNLAWGQLHSAPAGTSGTDNVTTSGRQPVIWGTPDSFGNFGLTSEIAFTDGDPGGEVYSVTLWDQETGGVFYGEFALDGDGTFGSAGGFSVTAIDFVGTSS